MLIENVEEKCNILRRKTAANRLTLVKTVYLFSVAVMVQL